ncbi:MAG: hypothetical protein WC514_01740 [Candidatus Paceibacterota bacterium]
MEDRVLPKSYGEESPSPIPFLENDELCKRLDALYQSSGIHLKIPPSSFFNGALYALRYKENPDWMAQVAHSLREILYQFKSKDGGWVPAFISYGSTYNKDRIGQDVGTYYRFISDIAHHRFEVAEKNPLIGATEDRPIEITPEIFEGVVLRFGKVLFEVLRRQIEVHKEIDDILVQ